MYAYMNTFSKCTKKEGVFTVNFVFSTPGKDKTPLLSLQFTSIHFGIHNSIQTWKVIAVQVSVVASSPDGKHPLSPNIFISAICWCVTQSVNKEKNENKRECCCRHLVARHLYVMWWSWSHDSNYWPRPHGQSCDLVVLPVKRRSQESTFRTTPVILE